MSSEDEAKKGEDRSKLWDWLFRILTALVIPLMIWGVKLEVNNAVLKERIAQFKTQLEEKVSQCERRIANRKSDIVNIGKTVHSNYGKLSAMDAKIDGVNSQLALMRLLLSKLQK